MVAVARIVWELPGDAVCTGRGMQVELVERARSGDHEAFSELASASFGRLFGAAKLILRDQDRAQDAVQEALVLAWKHVRAIRDPEAWDAWLYRLTVRACYRLARSAKRRDVTELYVEPDREPASHDFTGPHPKGHAIDSWYLVEGLRQVIGFDKHRTLLGKGAAPSAERVCAAIARKPGVIDDDLRAGKVGREGIHFWSWRERVELS